MKVAIVGAGIAGLATYHALRKQFGDRIEICVYESHKAPSAQGNNTIGAGLGLAPNGIRALHSISPASADFLQARGYTHPHMTFRNSTGQVLGHFPVGSAERYGFAQRFISREDVHRALMIGVAEEAIQWETKVSSIEERETDIRVIFADGSESTFDIIIGADGVKSNVSRAVLKDSERAQYSGTVGVGGFVPIANLPLRFQEGLGVDAVNMTFGPNGFFGCVRSDLTKSNVMWWSSFDAPGPINRDIPLDDIRQQLSERHGSWKTPHDDNSSSVFTTIINLACQPDSSHPVLVLPRYAQTELPTSFGVTSGRIVLIGDAAHALPSESGQGVSCAIEDAVAFARLLSFYTENRPGSSSVYAATLKAYEELRMPRLNQILASAKRKQPSKKSIGGFRDWTRGWMLWVLCKAGDKINDKTFAYDINAAVQSYLEGRNVPKPKSTSGRTIRMVTVGVAVVGVVSAIMMYK